MSTQSERVSHDRAVSFSSRAYHIHIHKDNTYIQQYYYYVQKKKRDLSRWKIFILSISIRVFEGKMCTRSTTSNNLHVPAALIRRFISLLSERKETAADWSHSRVQMPTKLSHFLTETNV